MSLTQRINNGNPTQLKWRNIPFSELSNEELYEILWLRQVVFVVEQDCPYIDADGKDQQSYHLIGRDEQGILQGYARLVPPGISYVEPSIGRIITAPTGRGQGLGIELMRVAISECERIFGSLPIRISAQTHLEAFYGKFNFAPTGKNYLEDGIPHSEMLRTQ